MEKTATSSLLKAPLHQFEAKDWPEWYEGVAALVESDDAETRAAAIERLSMAVFWSEHAQVFDESEAATAAKLERARWLLGLVDRQAERHDDVVAFFLHELRYKGDSEPYPQVILPWLRKLLSHSAGPLAERVEGLIVLIDGIADWDGKCLPEILDHPSDHVRACAAHVLGRMGAGESQDADGTYLDSDFIAALTARELERPGIAGPYWSSTGFLQSDFDNLGFEPLEWMLGIIERRQGPEPQDLPFNGIDFHVHELAGDHPGAVRRLWRARRSDLAAMAATEIRAVMPGMEAVLFELGDDAEAEIAVAAQLHLAAYYGVLHPKADSARIRYVPEWRKGVDAFVIHYGELGASRATGIFYPKGRAVLDDAEAWAAVDAALPAAERGTIGRHYLAVHDAAPGPYQMGADLLYSFENGARAELIGRRDGDGWIRVDVSPGRGAELRI
ncbi:hypothetical protein ASG47_06025 [Devosia sp. Leaf420]|uniref:hypothetical protein n=1 Tax=Devosia sp. Leaf420 TaxID=1736374 RepID=UPI0007126318|nr:hypothetical protein [Devosia sp. Leaf420]KQT47944.1 hypothetical protein ASG47_06025 [Devosia sp. Leaf420]